MRARVCICAERSVLEKTLTRKSQSTILLMNYRNRGQKFRYDSIKEDNKGFARCFPNEILDQLGLVRL